MIAHPRVRATGSKIASVRSPRARAVRAMASAAEAVVAVGHRFYGRGWVMGTSGNFSVVVGRSPLRLAITPSAAHKGALSASEILQIDAAGEPAGSVAGRPSAETALHLEIVRRLGAGAVLHTHSIWSTMLSERHAARRGFAIEGFEMLKGLDGVSTHTHREWVPIVENDQDMSRLAVEAGRVLSDYPAAHGFLIRRHGLYTWGRTLAEAERHVEIFEFLFETIGREGSGHGSRQHS
jgi:methylthioribulose-1-phosphate dehydratase